jgi:hypothetical protein
MTYATDFWLRAVSADGVVLKTFKPAKTLGRNISVQRGEGVYIEREDIAFNDVSYFVGWKQRVDVSFVGPEAAFIAGDEGTDSLEAVLNALPAGGHLEYTLAGADQGWTPCRVEDPTVEKPAGNNTAVRVAFSAVSLGVVAAPFRTST